MDDEEHTEAEERELVPRPTRTDGCVWIGVGFHPGFRWSRLGEARRFFPIAALIVSRELAIRTAPPNGWLVADQLKTRSGLELTAETR
jgi:hypothetical protein